MKVAAELRLHVRGELGVVYICRNVVGVVEDEDVGQGLIEWMDDKPTLRQSNNEGDYLFLLPHFVGLVLEVGQQRFEDSC